MAREAMGAVGWVLLGMVIMALLVWFSMPSMMLIERRSDRSYEQTVTTLGDAIARKQDWRVLAVNDYQKRAPRPSAPWSGWAA